MDIKRVTLTAGSPMYVDFDGRTSQYWQVCNFSAGDILASFGDQTVPAQSSAKIPAGASRVLCGKLAAARGMYEYAGVWLSGAGEAEVQML